MPIFCIAGQHCRIFAEGFFWRFRVISDQANVFFASLATKNIFISLAIWGVCDSNRIAHRGRIARFGPLVAKKTFSHLKNLLMRLFLMGCFQGIVETENGPLRRNRGKRPIKVGKRPIKEGKQPIKAMVLVGISVGCLMGCFLAPPPWRKTAPLKRPIKRSMNIASDLGVCDSNRIAQRGRIARFGPLRLGGSFGPSDPS